ncbi:MAG: hypothetical protein JKY44_09090 [Flavobacteriaceae bacterium]|nr:hypothetical protein [Flavobacteriaceae bacterium]
MKKLIVLFLGLTFSTTVLFANNDTPIEAAKKQLRIAVIKLLGNHEFPLTTMVAAAEISMLLSTKNELVIISVKSENRQLERYLKRKLNYKKVHINALIKIKIIQS